MTSFCSPEELAALTGLFKGAEAAEAFCTKLTEGTLTSGAGSANLADAGLTGRIVGIEEGLNTFFLTVNGALVFVMHAGFAMVSSAMNKLSEAYFLVSKQRQADIQAGTYFVGFFVYV
jgi:hypothetical protein